MIVKAGAIIKILEKMKVQTPYPEDIFIKPGPETMERLKFLFQGAKISQDGLMGSYARDVYRIAIDDVISTLQNIKIDMDDVDKECKKNE